MHVVAALRWIEACIGEPVPPTVELEEGLRNGVVLAKLAHFVCPQLLPLKKIFDADLSRYQVLTLRWGGTVICHAIRY